MTTATKNKEKPSANPPVACVGPEGAPPKKFRVRAYQVGFGDCFLLTFTYANKNKHVLVDFGTVRLPDNAAADHMKQIAADVKQECGDDGLYAVVVTHRHRDHISGFSTDHANDPGAIISALKPVCVLEPWTENPKAAPGATSAPEYDGPKQFSAMLLNMQAFAQRAAREAEAFTARGSNDVGELGLSAKNSLPNQSAVTNLQNMGTGKGNWNGHEYLSYGEKTRLVDDLPGVKVWVLGPPTLEQSQAISKESSSNPSEFWQLQKTSVEADTKTLAEASPFASLPSWRLPYPENVRWFMQRADAVRSEQLLGLVRILDAAMNNTSIILLLEIAEQRFVFPGDAQFENWAYALSQPGVLDLLHGIKLYKVGHHGSRNATPKSLWSAVKAHAAAQLATVVSTMPGVYGNPGKHTEVPRATLIEELREHSEFHSTQGQAGLYQDIIFSFS